MSLVDWIKEKAGDDSMKYILAGGLVLVIVIAMWGTISGMFGGNDLVEPPDESRFYDMVEEQEYTLTREEIRDKMADGQGMENMAGGLRMWSPLTDDWTGVPMVKCPECEKYYVTPEALVPPSNEYICPYCETDRREWYRKHAK